MLTAIASSPTWNTYRAPGRESRQRRNGTSQDCTQSVDRDPVEVAGKATSSRSLARNAGFDDRRHDAARPEPRARTPAPASDRAGASRTVRPPRPSTRRCRRRPCRAHRVCCRARVDLLGHLAEQSAAPDGGIGRDVRREDERHRARRRAVHGRQHCVMAADAGRLRRRSPRSRSRAGCRRRTSGDTRDPRSVGRGRERASRRSCRRNASVRSCDGRDRFGRCVGHGWPERCRGCHLVSAQPFHDPYDRTGRKHGQHRVDRGTVASDAERHRRGDRDRGRNREERQDRHPPAAQDDEPADRSARAAGSTAHVARRDCQRPRPSIHALNGSMFWPGRKRSHMRSTRWRDDAWQVVVRGDRSRPARPRARRPRASTRRRTTRSRCRGSVPSSSCSSVALRCPWNSSSFSSRSNAQLMLQ